MIAVLNNKNWSQRVATLKLDEIKDCMHTALENCGLDPEPESIELEAFVSSLISSIHLAVTHKVLDGKEYMQAEFKWQPSDRTFKFEFPFVSRKRILLEIRAGTGLPQNACDTALKSLENKVHRLLDQERKVSMEAVGEFTRKGTGEIIFELAEL